MSRWQKRESEGDVNGFVTGIEHIRAEMQLLDLYLQRQVARLRASRIFQEDDMRGLYITDEQVDGLLASQAEQESGEVAQATTEIRMLTAAIGRMRQEIDARLQASQEVPLLRLAKLFALTPFECQVLVLSVAVELDLRYETLYAYAQNDVTKKQPGIDLALKLFCADFTEYVTQLDSFASDAPLIRHQLVHVFDYATTHEAAFPSRFLKADQRIVDYLLEREKVDRRLQTFTRVEMPAVQWSELVVADKLCAMLPQVARLSETDGIVVVLHGPTGADKQRIAEAVCTALKRPLLLADVRRMPHNEQERQMLLMLLRREARLRGAGLYLAHSEVLLADEQTKRIMEAVIDTRDGCSTESSGFPLLLGCEVPCQLADVWPERQVIALDVALPDFPQRLHYWQEAWQAYGVSSLTDKEETMLASQLFLSGRQIHAAVRNAVLQKKLQGGRQDVLSSDDLSLAARQQLHHHLSQFAQKVELLYTWDDIVLPSRTLQQLHDIWTAVAYHHIVFAEWGFERKFAGGKGVTALFSGTSGTGKTMAASIIARELKRDLYTIDLANVVSKYIGETEKNLGHIFDEAQASNAILFFDEADALFGKRSEVRDAHDRYANIEVAYLLQKIEVYPGTVILATNLSKNLDDAFARRMQHVIEFPFPDATLRERIWRTMFPTATPIAESIDFGFLGRQFELAGGNIRNSVLAAAFLAAEENGCISMEHLVIAVARELRKMGKMPLQSSFQAYYELVRQKS